MTLSEQLAEAKKMHWEMYCGICDTCTSDAICSIACPEGGVDDGKTYQPVWKSECMNTQVDMVEVVRCRDCKHSEHWYRDKYRCFLWNENGIDVFEDGLCNYGKHKET